MRKSECKGGFDVEMTFRVEAVPGKPDHVRVVVAGGDTSTVKLGRSVTLETSFIFEPILEIDAVVEWEDDMAPPRRQRLDNGGGGLLPSVKRLLTP